MTKRILIALAVLIAMPAIAFAQKFGVVDTQTIVTSLPEFTALETEMTNISKKHEDELQNLRTRFEKDLADFQAMPEDTPESIKERRAADLQEQQQKIQQYIQIAQQDMQRQQQAKMEPIQKRVMDAITTVGNEGGFTMIFEKEQPLYIGATAEDVTAAVKAKLGL